MTTPDQRLQMARAIVAFEARFDHYGHLSIYRLPPDDGGGLYEVAGINDRYNPEAWMPTADAMSSMLVSR